jgi:glycine/D-amino acid oxidase-like deaminating enzyme/nitrite reductase/ring-hydroxylating ferredoxin subunit
MSQEFRIINIIKMKHPNTSAQQTGTITSGSNISYWLDSVEPIRFSPLRENQQTEVVIVGGGISGLSVAYCLSKAGKKVMVVDDGFIGSGESGRTTAHLVNALDDRYFEIERLLGEEKCRLAAESHTGAINFVEQTVQEENIDCDFQRLDGFLFLHPTDDEKTIDEEFIATNKHGLRTEKINGVPGIAGENGICLRFPEQAQFHPMKYLKGLCDCIVRNGGTIYTETHVEGITKNGIRSKDFSIKAEHVVVATNTPINNLVTMHTKQHPYRTYVVGGLIAKNSIRPALWWDTGNMKSEWITDPYHYVRLQPFNETHDLLIAGGEDHKTGQADKENLEEKQRYAKLERWTRNHFPSMTEIVYHWSGQVMEPVDMMAFIGKNPGDKNIYIATGDSGNGMTHGTIAGMLISDLILGRNNPWTNLYDPSRITLKAAKEFLTEAGNMTAQYLDYFQPGDVESINLLAPGQGAIVNMKGKKVAVYKDESQMVHTFSAVCPHMGCILQWNSDERSFDCPCHGSRFTCMGAVVNGPAIGDMERVEVKA